VVDIRNRRPAAPHPAERARTIAAHGGPSTLLHTEAGPGDQRVSPTLQHVHADGSASVLLPRGDPLTTERNELSVMLELTDPAPVPLREPVRGLLWITGWLSVLDPAPARSRAVAIAEARPDPRLLDVGHGLAVLRLRPVSLVLADAEGTHNLAPHQFAAAAPDPFHVHEIRWLQHLAYAHPEAVDRLARHLPAELAGGHIRPLGLDRFGLRLRIESGAGDHDVRLAFSRPVDDPGQLAAEMRRLVGCPFSE
jgi:hypothetical protein